MFKIISVVEYLHANSVSHRDLKPDNFLFVNKGIDSEIKVIDFGLSTLMKNRKNESKKLKTLVGTPIYMAPEVI